LNLDGCECRGDEKEEVKEKRQKSKCGRRWVREDRRGYTGKREDAEGMQVGKEKVRQRRRERTNKNRGKRDASKKSEERGERRTKPKPSPKKRKHEAD